MPTYNEWMEEAEYEQLLNARFKELSEKLKEKGLRVRVYIKERTSRNALNEIIDTKFYAQVDNLMKVDEFDDVDIDDIRLLLTDRGLDEFGITQHDPIPRMFSSKEECRKALLPALVKYFITDEYRSVVSVTNVFTLGDIDE